MRLWVGPFTTRLVEIFDLDQINAALDDIDLVPHIEEGFVAYSRGEVVVPEVPAEHTAPDRDAPQDGGEPEEGRFPEDGGTVMQLGARFVGEDGVDVRFDALTPGIGVDGQGKAQSDEASAATSATTSTRSQARNSRRVAAAIGDRYGKG